MELSNWFGGRRGVLSVREVGAGEASWRKMAVAGLGWSRSESGIDGANSMERAEVGSGESLRVGLRFIVKVLARGDLEDVGLK